MSNRLKTIVKNLKKRANPQHLECVTICFLSEIYFDLLRAKKDEKLRLEIKDYVESVGYASMLYKV